MIQLVIILLALFSFVFPGEAAAITQITAIVSDMVEFKCHFQNPQNYSIHQLIYIWEKNEIPENLVLAELFGGERKYTHISKRYKDRRMEIMPNGDLKMFNVTLEDEGDYSCYVRKRGKNIEIIHKKECKLIVLANFSVPQINNGNISKVEKDSVVNFHCSSNGGFPKPYGILWTVSDDNETQNYSKTCHLESGPLCDIKNDSKTFDISSNLTVTMKNNISITCTVLAHHNVSSRMLHIDVHDENTSKENGNLKYILPCVILITITSIACSAYFGFWMKGKTSKSRSSPNNRETSTTAATNSVTQQLTEETTSFI